MNETEKAEFDEIVDAVNLVILDVTSPKEPIHCFMNDQGKMVCSYREDYIAENPDTELEMPETRVVCKTLRYGHQDCKVIEVKKDGNRRLEDTTTTETSDTNFTPPITVFCEPDGADDYTCTKMSFDSNSITPADAAVGNSVWPSFCQKHESESAKHDDASIFFCQKPAITAGGSVVLPYGVEYPVSCVANTDGSISCTNLVQFDKAYLNTPEYAQFPMYCSEKTSTGDFSCDVVINEPASGEDNNDEDVVAEDGFDSKMALIIVVVAIAIFLLTLVTICCLKRNNNKDHKTSQNEVEMANLPNDSAQGADDQDSIKKPVEVPTVT